VALGIGALQHETGAVAAPRVLGEAPFVRADAKLVQNLTVERPAGQIAVEVSPIDSAGHFAVTVTDTRDDDPGWSVAMTLTDATGRPQEWAPAAIAHTPVFADASGTSYAQDVVAGTKSVLGSARRGHGLGIARLDAVTAAASDSRGVAIRLTVV
jgi:hypothetical protein